MRAHGARLLYCTSNCAHVELTPDSDGKTRQGFFIDLRGNGLSPSYTLTIEGLDKSFAPEAWLTHDIFESPNGGYWRPIRKEYCGSTVLLRPRTPECCVSYSLPYPRQQYDHVINVIRATPHCAVVPIAYTERNCPLFGCVIRPPDSTSVIALVARQHPGESPSAFFAEGFIDAAMRSVHDDCPLTILAVPLANPDGLFTEQYRCNASGADLNRCWNDPRLNEVRGILRWLSGPSKICLFVDIHADERTTKPYVVFGRPASNFCHDIREQLLRTYTNFGECISVDCSDDPTYSHPGISVNLFEQKMKTPSMMIELPMSFHGLRAGESFAHYLLSEGSKFYRYLQRTLAGGRP